MMTILANIGVFDYDRQVPIPLAEKGRLFGGEDYLGRNTGLAGTEQDSEKQECGRYETGVDMRPFFLLYLSP